MTGIKIDDATIHGERIWGAKAIASIVGCTPDHVSNLEKHPAVPIFKPPGSGRYCAYKSELIRWTRTKSSSDREIPDLT